MNLSPIPTVLSILWKHRVKALLMGGQACILYGAAEFSRDVDIAASVDPADLDRLRSALKGLDARPVFFPPLSESVLKRGHACHFRCHAAGLMKVRLDVMSVMRNADPFEKLWARRARLSVPGVGIIPVISLKDLVQIKKTQREKDWPMLKRLVEADIVRARAPIPARRVRFWLRECRTVERLSQLAAQFPRLAKAESRNRSSLKLAMSGDTAGAERELVKEQQREKELDRQYWAPLRAELERWRMQRPRRGK